MYCDFHEHQPTRVNTSFCLSPNKHLHPYSSACPTTRHQPRYNVPLSGILATTWPYFATFMGRQSLWNGFYPPPPRLSPPDHCHFLSTRCGAQWHTFLVSHSPVSRELGLAVLIPRFTIEPRMATYFTTSRAHTCLPRDYLSPGYSSTVKADDPCTTVRCLHNFSSLVNHYLVGCTYL